MPFDPQKHHRQSIRLKGYDYTQPGMYFVTFCVRERVCELGEIRDGEMMFSLLGRVIFDFWGQVPVHFPGVEVDTFVVMPNHVHAIITIIDRRGDVSSPKNLPLAQGGETPPLQGATLGKIVAYYKYQTTVQINALRDNISTPFWQRGYYEHIVRNERELQNIRKYIRENPLKWEFDRDNPASTYFVE